MKFLHIPVLCAHQNLYQGFPNLFPLPLIKKIIISQYPPSLSSNLSGSISKYILYLQKNTIILTTTTTNLLWRIRLLPKFYESLLYFILKLNVRAPNKLVYLKIDSKT